MQPSGPGRAFKGLGIAKHQRFVGCSIWTKLNPPVISIYRAIVGGIAGEIRWAIALCNVWGPVLWRSPKRFYKQGDGSKTSADQLNHINDVLLHLDQAQPPGDLDLPGYRGRPEGLLEPRPSPSL